MDSKVYVLPDGREFHSEDRRKPAVMLAYGNLFLMGNNTGIVVGEAMVIPDPEKHPEMIEEVNAGYCRLKPENEWPKMHAETFFIRGVAGRVDMSIETISKYLTRLHTLGIAVEKDGRKNKNRI